VQVEKSLQRIHRGQKNAMYTTQKSIENKVGHVNGWKDLLMSVGFRFEPAANGIPSSVFFPQSDPDERLTQCSASLQALLGRYHIAAHFVVICPYPHPPTTVSYLCGSVNSL
jgi:hypothetical protein